MNDFVATLQQKKYKDITDKSGWEAAIEEEIKQLKTQFSALYV